jgi:twitching motility protein PilT
MASAMLNGGLVDITQLLAYSVKNRASDLHLSAGHPPMLRIHGDIRRLDVEPLTSEAIWAMLHDVQSESVRERFRSRSNYTFMHGIEGLSRFRVTRFKHREGIGAVFRTVPHKILTLEQLGVPSVLSRLCKRPSGLLLVSGKIGSGRTTTLAAMIDEINTTECAQITTIESPIEFIHQSQRSLILQREVGVHADSYVSALEFAVSGDSDAIVVGELKDPETTRLALLAAEMGHLVLAGVNTASAIGTIDRLISSLPGQDRELMRNLLADNLIAVVSQWLARLKDKSGRVAVQELLINTPTVRALIRQDRFDDLYSVMEASTALGMSTLDQSLARLHRSGMITVQEARLMARYPNRVVGLADAPTVANEDRPMLGLIVRRGTALPGHYS